MDRRRVRKGISRKAPALRPADVRTLARSRWVQALLLATFVAQGVAVVSGGGGGDETAIRVSATVSPADTPRLTRVDSAKSAPASDAARDESARLAAEYRAKGFRVSDALAGEIARAARENGIDARVAFGLVAVESEFKPTALSPVGAIGLAQLMPATARLLRPGTTRSDLREPEINLSLGFRFLRDLLVKYDGDTTLALLAYNRGPGTVDRILERGGNPDNGYADRVLGKD